MLALTESPNRNSRLMHHSRNSGSYEVSRWGLQGIDQSPSGMLKPACPIQNDVVTASFALQKWFGFYLEELLRLKMIRLKWE